MYMKREEDTLRIKKEIRCILAREVYFTLILHEIYTGLTFLVHNSCTSDKIYISGGKKC